MSHNAHVTPIDTRPVRFNAAGAASCATGVAVLVWAFVDGRFRDGEGFLDTGICLPLSAGAALLVAGWALASRGVLTSFVLWSALALAGQAVTLQMIHAGNGVVYQHYRGVGELLTEVHPLLPLFVVGQTLFVVIGLIMRRSEWVTWIGRHLRLWRMACVGLVVFLSSATKINAELAEYATELVLATFLQLVNLGAVVLAVLSLPKAWPDGAPGWLVKLLSTDSQSVGGARPLLDRWALLAAVWVVGSSYALCVVSYERHPHIPDEVVYLMHARYFAEGHLTLPAPTVPAGFDLYLMELENGRWYSPVPPGWPAVLAVGVLLGSPWLVNPILAGLTVIGVFGLLREMYDRRTARIGVLLMAASPWFLFMAMNLLTHTLTLALAVAATLCVVRARNTGRAAWGWLGGAAIGVIALVRPLEGFAMAGLLGIWAIGIGGRRIKFGALAGLVLGAIATGAVVLPYNNYLTGSPTHFPIMAYVDKHFGPGKNSLGFGPEKGLGWRGVDAYPGHGAKDVLMNTNVNVFALNTELFGWSTGSLLLIAVALFSRGGRRSDRPMLAVIGVIVGLHALYWFSGGPDFGARYWYLVLVPCVALTLSGAHALSRGSPTSTPPSNGSGGRVLTGVLLLSALALVNFVPWRAIDKYHHYRRLRPDIRELAREHDFGRSLVLVRGNAIDDYISAFVYNPMNLNADAPIYAWDRDPATRAALLSAYADRPVWIVDGMTLTDGAYRLVAGPISAADLAAGKYPELPPAPRSDD